MPSGPDALRQSPAGLPELDGIHIGTSGWNYPLWRSRFYANVPQRGWLAHCIDHLTAIEVNATFFRFINPDVVATWRAAAAPGFVFALKGHRFITHTHRLKDVAPMVQRMRESARPLGTTLAAVLWQLPASLFRDLSLLADFSATLDGWPEARHAIEFRHHSWRDDAVTALMAAKGLAICRAEGAEWPTWSQLTGDLVYVRLYGLVEGAPPRNLDRWAEEVRHWRAAGRQVHLYFDADDTGQAPYDAIGLIARLRGDGGTRPAIPQ